MKTFLDDQFLLSTETARRLYHDHAAPLPIYDYHCHLPPREILEDKQYDNLGACWLAGDHYKWRAMRANGVAEEFVTGGASWRDKFAKWAETVPQTLRNPLYHWTHLELRRYFGINTLLGPQTADEIYQAATEQLRRPAFSVRNLLRMMKVTVVCTSDDPADDLQWHARLRDEDFEIRVLPTFRPDKAINLGDTRAWREYLERLGAAAGVTITGPDDLLAALDQRHAAFHALGCRLSDHGLACLPDTDASAADAAAIFQQAWTGADINPADRERLTAWLLYEIGTMNHRRGWAQQFHLGAFRNTNTRMFRALGPDSGFDSMGDHRQGPGLVRLLDKLDTTDQLARTILYNNNPADNELLATMIGNYQDGRCPGKMQFGPAWWFLDQQDGIERHLNALSALGLLSRFVGMVTDSRSFLSYPRHEYFRRILCNLLGRDVENGVIPNDPALLGQLVENVCYHNAVRYFGIDLPGSAGGNTPQTA